MNGWKPTRGFTQKARTPEIVMNDPNSQQIFPTTIPIPTIVFPKPTYTAKN